VKYLILFYLLSVSYSLNAQSTAVAAHRGKAFLVPENTIRGMNKLLPSGIKYIEIDVRTSKDGELVIMHDGSLKRTTNNKAKVNELTLEELKNVKVTGWFNIRFKKNSIPTLDEVCSLIADWNNRNSEQQVHLYVDCKDADPIKLLNILQKYRLSHSSVFYGNDKYLQSLRELDPELKIMPGLKSPKDLEAKVTSLRPFAFDVSYTILTPELLSAIHSRDIRVFSDLLFLNDRKSAYKKAQKMGVDVVQTDKAKKVVRIIKNNIHTLHKRQKGS
jgi:glycerophosphoryl diester phosphodiesterase